MTPRILVAGGCHVDGYPIGTSNSFVQVLREELKNYALHVDIRTLSYLPVHHLERLKVAMSSYEPHVVVLQLGNYETTVTFRDYFRQRFGLKRKKSHSIGAPQDPAQVFRQTRAWKWKCRAKLLLDEMLDHCLVDQRIVQQNLATMLELIRTTSSDCKVILVTPLPCADPLYAGYRLDLDQIFLRQAALRRCQYLPFPPSGEDCRELFVDATHLNGMGHQHLGRAIAFATRRVLAGEDQPMELTALQGA